MKTAAAYIRVSTDEQTEYSPESQIREIRKYAAAHDMLLSDSYIFMDEGISGRNTKKRNAFNRMIGAAKSKPRPFDVILLWKYSRFARNQEESIVYKSLLRRQLGIDVLSISEPLIDGPFGSLIERIIEWMDEYYSIRLSGEVTRGMTEKALRGEIQTSTPYGYRKDGKEWIVQPEEAEIVSYIYDSFIKGNSIDSVVKAVNLMGARTKHNNPLYAQRVKYILANPAYTGTLVWNGIEHKERIPAIVSQEVWEQASMRLSRLSGHWNKHAKPVGLKHHYLSGLIKCADCGSGMVYNSANKGFQCSAYRSKACTSHFLSVSRAETALIDALQSLFGDLLQIRRYKKFDLTNESGNSCEAFRIQSETNRCLMMLQNAREAYLEGVDSLVEYTDNKSKLTLRMKELDQLQRSSLPAAKEPSVKKNSHLIAFLRDSNVDLKEKQSVLQSFIRKIEYKKPEEELIIYLYS